MNMTDSERWRLDVGLSRDVTKLRNVELYANAERLGAVTDNGSEDRRAHVIREKQHTPLLLHLIYICRFTLGHF